MPVTIADFEVLDFAHLISIGGFGWSAPLLQADFGGGYGAGVLANASYGLHRWTIRAPFLPDTSQFTGGDDNDYYFTYFFSFFQRHILRGNKPFILTDPRDRYYLVRFASRELDVTRLTRDFYSNDGLAVIEARHPDLDFYADGSLIIEPATIGGSLLDGNGAELLDGNGETLVM